MAADSRREQLKERAKFLKEQGLDFVVDRPSLHPVPKKAAPQKADAVKAEIATAAPRTPPLSAGASDCSGTGSPELMAVRTDLGDCRRCGLCEGRTNLVFGVGNPRARLMFIGEGPGADEDAKGEPFVGRAGQLLTDIITKGMGLRRPEDIYIANIVKCRPPENRAPQPAEASACLPFLRAQISAISPEVIVTLGRIPLAFLFGREPESVKITQERGRWLSFKNIPVMPTFHPSYLLRNPSAKKEVWVDVQEVLAKLGLTPPTKPGR